MDNITPRRAVAKWISRKLDALDQRMFYACDVDAAARGWQIKRDRRFHRIYRDPRWDLIGACPACEGDGTIGTSTCRRCDGHGTVSDPPLDRCSAS